MIDGVTFDKNQNMMLTDYMNSQDDVYARLLGAPTATIPLVSVQTRSTPS